MVHGFVLQSGGVIDVQSKPAKGTTFRLCFPAVENETESANASLRATDLPRGSGTILVVEDEEAVRRVLLETLGKCGYVALSAGNAQKATSLIESAKRRIDLLITDVVMPGPSGVELAQYFNTARPGVRSS